MLSIWLLGTATLVLVTLTLLPLSRHPIWWIRALDFPRVQLAVLAAVVAVAGAAWLQLDGAVEWSIVLLATGCGGYHLIWIWPYTPLAPREVRSASGTGSGVRLRILASNVLMTNRRWEALVQLVRKWQPDVLVVVETNTWWEQRLSVLLEDYPHTLCCPLENLYGMHLFSRLPLIDPKIQFLVEDDKPSMHTLVQLPDGRHVQLHCLHPAPPSPTENDSSSERDAELVMVGRAVAQMPLPVIVTGDLNDVAWSATTRLFRKLSGLLDPRIGRGSFSTFHTRYPFVRWPLDHFFHSRGFTLGRLQRLPSIGSDHFPIFIDLVLGDRRAGEQADEGLRPDDEDHEDAREKVAAEGVSPRQVHCPLPPRSMSPATGYEGRRP